ARPLGDRHRQRGNTGLPGRRRRAAGDELPDRHLGRVSTEGAHRPGASLSSPRMHYRLRDNLSHCVIGDHAVFLDVEADRYFTLPDHLQRAFLAFAGDRHHAAASPALLASGLLVAAGPGEIPAVRLESPTRSAREMPATDAARNLLVIPELLATTWRCRRQLRRRSLRSVLDSAARYRDLRCVPRTGAAARASEQYLLRPSRAFLQARR